MCHEGVVFVTDDHVSVSHIRPLVRLKSSSGLYLRSPLDRTTHNCQALSNVHSPLDPAIQFLVSYTHFIAYEHVYVHRFPFVHTLDKLFRNSCDLASTRHSRRTPRGAIA